jgi:hypothetical protein
VNFIRGLKYFFFFRQAINQSGKTIKLKKLTQSFFFHIYKIFTKVVFFFVGFVEVMEAAIRREKKIITETLG